VRAAHVARVHCDYGERREQRQFSRACGWRQRLRDTLAACVADLDDGGFGAAGFIGRAEIARVAALLPFARLVFAAAGRSADGEERERDPEMLHRRSPLAPEDTRRDRDVRRLARVKPGDLPRVLVTFRAWPHVDYD
jgi:hypothetical protein